MLPRQLHLQSRLADADEVAYDEHRFVHAVAVDPRPVAAVDVDDRQPGVVAEHDAVRLADGIIEELHVAVAGVAGDLAARTEEPRSMPPAGVGGDPSVVLILKTQLLRAFDDVRAVHAGAAPDHAKRPGQQRKATAGVGSFDDHEQRERCANGGHDRSQHVLAAGDNRSTIRDMSGPPLAIPAATVVVARVVADEGHGAFEIYLVKRSGRSGFMAGVHVFPGGRVEADDGAFDVNRSAVAAIRETWEECGVLLARPESGLPLSTRAPIDAVAARSAAGEPFGHALRAAGLVPDVEALVPIAWWVTPDSEPKRFDTRFFFAVVPPLQRHDAGVDGTEVTEGAWWTPRAALAAYRDDTIRLAPPTLVLLEELGAHPTIDRVRTARWPQQAVRPIAGDDDGRLVLALPGDPLHEVDEPLWAHRTRVVVDDQGRFRSACVRR